MQRSSPTSLRRRSATRRGFTLVEAVIGLGVVGVVLLVGLASMLEHRRALEAVERHREALAVLDRALEAVRSGVLPLEEGPVEMGSPEARLLLAAAPGSIDPGTDSDSGGIGPEGAGPGGAGPGGAVEGGAEEGGEELLRLRLEVEALGRPGLTRVRVVASYPVHGRVQERSVETLVWRAAS